MPQESRPVGVRLFGVTIAPALAPAPELESDPLDRDPSPNPPVAAGEDVMRKCKSMATSPPPPRAPPPPPETLGAPATGTYPTVSCCSRPASGGARRSGRKLSLGLKKSIECFLLIKSFDRMENDMSPAPNCPIFPILSPSMGKVHDMMAMTKQLQNSRLEGVSSSNIHNLYLQAARDLPPSIPSFKATNIDSSLSKMNYMEGFWRPPLLFRPIPRIAEGTSSLTPATANIAASAFQANLTACTNEFLSPQSNPSPLPKKSDPPAEQRDLDLTVAPPSQQTRASISSQNAVGGVIQVI
ncbi:hypothetical protein GUJ93_ZPchr0010g7654 [Zizania palustris]|uniref:Uncharacterized protein n=1 Tax=Zizania palustris TaxID=103762 RepID=A0A8J6BK73_ZIZPA|nr:hypothetical protein GUJ93_ZPchr0010g7654 [Zizania palustris]